MQLLRNQKSVVLITNDYRRRQILQTLQTLQCLLQHGQLTGQGLELFWVRLARNRPQTAADAAGKKNGC